MPVRPGYSVANLSVTTSWVAGELGAAQDLPSSGSVPATAHLARLEVALTDIVTGTELSFFLSYDADGAEAITPYESDGATQTISLLPTVGDSGSAVWDLTGQPLILRDAVYVWLKLDAGTAAARVSLIWEVVS